MKVRKGTFSCWECKRRKKRCIISSNSISRTCNSCQRLGCRCVGQEHGEIDSIEHAAAHRRLDHLEQLAASLVERTQRSRPHAARRTLTPYSTYLISPLTGAGEDRTSRCRSLSGYFCSVLPHPFIASIIQDKGKSAYDGVREPMRLTKTSLCKGDELPPKADLAAAYLARKLIRLAVALLYMDQMAPEHLQALGLTASAMDTAHRYVEAARHLTSQSELLRSATGLECVMMEGYYNVHRGRIREAGLSFRRALHVARHIQLPEQTATKGHGTTARSALFLLITANRSLSLYHGEACDDVDEDSLLSHTKTPTESEPYERLQSVNVRIWRRLIARNVRIRRSWKSNLDREAALDAESTETLSIDQDMKQAMHSIPSTWWDLPANPKGEAYAGSAETNFNRLQTSKDHFNTLILTHLPYILKASTTTSYPLYAYNRAVALAASREVLLRFPLFQQYKHVPASYRALEHKCFIAGLVLLLAHMHIHRSEEWDAINHERPRDLNILAAAVKSMEELFARDRHNPGSECARVLRRLMTVEQEMVCGALYCVTCSYERETSASALDEGSVIDIQLPYFGTLRIERAAGA